MTGQPNANPVVEQPAVLLSQKPVKDVRQMRKQRLRLLLLKLLFAVGIPTLLASLYWGLMASDYYTSHAEFVIHSADGNGSPILDSLLGAGMGASVSDKDARLAKEYLESRDALRKLMEEHRFVEVYSDAALDRFSRLEKDATLENAYEYYTGGWRKGLIGVDFDSMSGVAQIRYRAPSPEQAKHMLEALLGYAEKVVNDLSNRSRQDQLNFARRELALAEARLLEARSAMLAFQNTNEEMDPAKAATSVATIKGVLEGELAKTQTLYSEMRAYMQPDAPQVKRLASRIASLKLQIERENQRLVNTDGEDALNETIARYEAALMEKEFAQKSYQAALTYLETARAESARQIRYLSVIVPPSVPSDPDYPERLHNVLTVFFLSFIFYLLISMLIASVREHAKI